MTPQKIVPKNAHALNIHWSPEHVVSLAYFDLRFFCPCASCVDEHSGQRVLEKGDVAADIRVVDVKLVGRYGVQISFSDGHSTGLYHFEKLWSLCENQGQKEILT
jgi:DUF971 family protein